MQAQPVPMAQPRIVGRYALYGEIAAGGMATVHFGRLVGAVGFSRLVAIKRLHAQFAKDPDFVSMFLDEARLVSRIQHPNVATTLDVVPLDDEVFLVMEYVLGEALSKLIRAARRNGELVPPRIAVAVMAGALHGLHAAHEAKSERGEPLNIVHRDVSPQNILVGTDGVARVLDFGVAKAAARATSTRDGQMKGKVSYMAPEQLRGKGVDRRTDVFAAGVVLWEALTGRRLFDGEDPGEVLTKLLEAEIPIPSSLEPTVPAHLDEIVMKALQRNIDARWSSAREFAIALEQAGPIALPREVGEWAERVGEETIGKRARQVAEIESGSLAHIRAVDSVPTSTPSYGSHPSHSQPFTPVPAQWPVVGPQGEPTTSPSQVSHVTGVSRPSNSVPSYVTGPSQVSAMSAVQAPAPQRTGMFAALVGIAGALAIALLAVVAIYIGKRQQPDVLPMEPAPPTATAAPTATEAQPDPSPAPSPSIVAVDQLPEVEASASAAPKKPPPRTGGGTWKPPVKTPPKPAAGDNCDPPFYIDKGGVRRVKSGCM